MAVYVDAVRRHGSGLWCHLMTDGSTEELLAFALSIGMKRSWIQREGSCYEHFDLRPTMRDRAIANGAIFISSDELVRRCVQVKRVHP